MNSIVSTLWTPLADHLWQSTVFAAAVWLLTLLLRKSRARIRYGLWLTASAKLLLPFSLLVSMGSLLPQRTKALSPAQTPLYAGFYASGDAMSQPFANLRPAPGREREMH
jgi:bla regulator protein BlaR1